MEQDRLQYKAGLPPSFAWLAWAEQACKSVLGILLLNHPLRKLVTAQIDLLQSTTWLSVDTLLMRPYMQAREGQGWVQWPYAQGNP